MFLPLQRSSWALRRTGVGGVNLMDAAAFVSGAFGAIIGYYRPERTKGICVGLESVTLSVGEGPAHCMLSSLGIRSELPWKSGSSNHNTR